MANNYTQGSGMLFLEDPSHASWVEDFIEKRSSDGDWEYTPFEYGVEGGSIWFYGEEHINIEAVAEVALAYFKEFDVNNYFAMSCAYSCSKMRVDEFGGDAVFVTREGIDYISCYGWMVDRQEKFEKNQGLIQANHVNNIISGE